MNPFLLPLLFLPLLTAAAAAAGTLQGKGWVLFRDFPGIFAASVWAQPWCNYSYAHLDLDRIATVQDLTADQCGACMWVCGARGCTHVMAVDRGGGRGILLSTGIRTHLFHKHDEAARVEWISVPRERCSDIYWKGQNHT